VVRKTIEEVAPHLLSRWTLHAEACVEVVPGGCKGTARFDPKKNDYSKYERIPRQVFLPAIRSADPNFVGWDYVVVDGRSRVRCMLQALGAAKQTRRASDDSERIAGDTPKRLPLLHVASYGILVMDNAQRAEYGAGKAAVPPSWLHAPFYNDNNDTATDLWMACQPSDAHCTRARHAINASFAEHFGILRKQATSTPNSFVPCCPLAAACCPTRPTDLVVPEGRIRPPVQLTAGKFSSQPRIGLHQLMRSERRHRRSGQGRSTPYG